jgi:hypothetical protein
VSGRIAALLAVVWLASPSPEPVAAEAGPHAWRFDREIVRLFVEGETLRVEGHYFFSRGDAPGPPLTLLYPYPADSLLGEARTTRLEARASGGEWRPLPVHEKKRLPAALWRIPSDLGDRIEVRTTYEQELIARYARYIVTTTAAWKRPLTEARFEIHLPSGATPTRMSYPFRRVEEEGRTFLLYEVEDFAPTEDVIVEWERRDRGG